MLPPERERFQMDKFISGQYPDVEGYFCIEVKVPASMEYVYLLQGLVAQMCHYWNYSGTGDNRKLPAQLCENAYEATDWGACMDCEGVADCIETSEPVQDALEQNTVNNINNSMTVQQALQQQIQQQLAANNPVVGSDDDLFYGMTGCDPNKIWGASDSLIEWLNINNVDFFEKLVAAITPADRATVMSETIPGFAGGVLGEGLSAAMTFLAGALKTNYEAFYDTAYANALKCELFCLSRGDCSVTIDQLYALFSARVGDTFIDFYSGFIFAVTGSWTGSQFADVMMFVQVGAFKFMGGFGGLLGVNPLANAIAEGYNDPDDDWITTCDDCPPEWCLKIDATNGLDTLFFATGSLGAQAVWTGTGWGANAAIANSRITIGISLPSAHNMTQIRVVLDADITNGDTNTTGLLEYPSFAVVEVQPAVTPVLFDLGVLPVQQFAIDCIADANHAGVLITSEITEIWLSGIGTPPDIGDPCP